MSGNNTVKHMRVRELVVFSGSRIMTEDFGDPCEGGGVCGNTAIWVKQLPEDDEVRIVVLRRV